MSRQIPIHIAVEDPLSESAIRRLLQVANPNFVLGTVYGKRGNAYLRSRINAWNGAAKFTPFLVLTDLDNTPCAPALRDAWLSRPAHPNLIFRVAVREVEAWLLADQTNLADYLAVPLKLIPTAPDTLADPKAKLVSIAAKSKRKAIRDDLVPRKGSTRLQGPAHNGTLGRFIETSWDVVAASQASPSLHRALTRLRHFQPRWEQA